MDLKEK
jgi:hypothetical protein